MLRNCVKKIIFFDFFFLSNGLCIKITHIYNIISEKLCKLSLSKNGLVAILYNKYKYQNFKIYLLPEIQKQPSTRAQYQFYNIHMPQQQGTFRSFCRLVQIKIWTSHVNGSEGGGGVIVFVGKMSLLRGAACRGLHKVVHF